MGTLPRGVIKNLFKRLSVVSLSSLCVYLYTVSQKRDPNIIDCNFRRDSRILRIFGTNIPETTGHQMAIQFPTSPNICFYTTWEKQNKRDITFYTR